MSERFLGGKSSTIVLCHTDANGELITKGQLKNALRVKDGFFRKSNGYFSKFITDLEYVKKIVNNDPQSRDYTNYRPQITTDYFVTSFDASIDLLSKLKFSQQIVVGFHLYSNSLIDLDKLIKDRRKIIHTKEQGERIITQLDDIRSDLISMGFSYPAITIPDMESLKNFTDEWGKDLLLESYSKIVNWYDEHKLRDYIPVK